MDSQKEAKQTPEQSKFAKALSSLLSMKPDDPKLSEARDEPPSPHTRYKYDPEADHS